MVRHRRSARGEGKVLLERPCRSDNGVALHLEGVQGEWHAGVVRPVTHVGGIGVVERVFMKITVSFKSPNAGDVRREVGGSLASLRTVSCDRTVTQEDRK